MSATHIMNRNFFSMPNAETESLDKAPPVAAWLFGGIILFSAALLAYGTYLAFGFLAETGSVADTSKVLVGTLLTGFFFYILLDKTEPVAMLDEPSIFQFC